MKKILLTTLTTIIFFNTSFSQLSFYSKDKLENTLSITLYDDIVNQFSGDRKALYQKFDKNLNSIEKKEMTWSPVRRIQRRDFSDYFDIGLSDGKKFSTYYTLTDEKNNIEAIQDEKGNVWELNKDFVPLIIDKKYHIGQRFQGGVIFYIDESGSNGLICSEDDLSYGIRWCNDKFIITGATGVRFGDGYDNTKKIIKKQGNGNYAAKLCADYRGGGYSDWYLPSEAELDILYKRSFQVGKFQWKLYWSSTEIGGEEAYKGARAETFDFFDHGATSNGVLSMQKDLTYPVRAIRNFTTLDHNKIANIKNESKKVESESEIKIGKQIWRIKNLDVDTFLNGDQIKEAKSVEDWIKANESRQPAWCYYDDINKLQNRKLYNWYAVNDKRGLSPKGWHIPSYDEWKLLINTLGGESFPNSGESVSGLSNKIKSSNGWSIGMNGNNESGFNCTPDGFRTWDGLFSNIGHESRFWCSTRYHQNFAWAFSISDSDVLYIIDSRNGGALGEGYSVRCVKNYVKK